MKEIKPVNDGREQMGLFGSSALADGGILESAFEGTSPSLGNSISGGLFVETT